MDQKSKASSNSPSLNLSPLSYLAYPNIRLWAQSRRCFDPLSSPLLLFPPFFSWFGFLVLLVSAVSAVVVLGSVSCCHRRHRLGFLLILDFLFPPPLFPPFTPLFGLLFCFRLGCYCRCLCAESFGFAVLDSLVLELCYMESKFLLEFFFLHN